MGSGAARRVWQEQTDHKLVRHPTDDPTRLCKKAGVDAKARTSIGAAPVMGKRRLIRVLVTDANVVVLLCGRVSQTLDLTSVFHS